MSKQKFLFLFVLSSWGAVSWPLPRNSLPAPPGGKKDIWAIAVVVRLGSKGTGVVSAESLILSGTDMTPPVGWEQPFTAQGSKFSPHPLPMVSTMGKSQLGGRNLGRKQREPGAGRYSQHFPWVEMFLT